MYFNEKMVSIGIQVFLLSTLAFSPAFVGFFVCGMMDRFHMFE